MLSASDLLTWQYAKVGNSCLLAPPSNIARDWDLVKGVPRAANFQPDARCSMDPGFPKLVGLTDNTRNPSSLIIASRRLQEFLAAKVLKNVEFLPISIVNHKGRVASADYFIVHPVYPQDCLDVDASGCEYNLLIKTYIDAVKRIVIAFNRLDPDVSVFRVKNFRSLILVMRTLAAELVAAGFSGLRFGELQDYRD